MDRILVVTIPSLVVLGALYWLRARWGVESIYAVCYELAARLLPGRPRSLKGLQRVIVRRACAANFRMPSGTIKVPEVIEVTLSEDDFAALTELQGQADVQADLANVVTGQARRSNWTLPADGPFVVLVVSPLIHPGWVPTARGTRVEVYRDGPGAGEDTDSFIPDWLTPAPRMPEDTVPRLVTTPPATAGGRVTVAYTPPVTVPLAPAAELVGADGTVYRVTRSGVRVGRDDDCDVRLVESVVSRRHAELVCLHGTWHIRDLGSKNGTYVAGAKVTGAGCPVTWGASIRFGSGGPSLTLQESTEGPGPTRPYGEPAEAHR